MNLNTYEELRVKIAALPVIDTHEHTIEPQNAPEPYEPIANVVIDYTHDDLCSAGAAGLREFFKDQRISTEKKWPTFEKFWQRTQFTGYAMLTKRVMKEFYGESEMSLAALQRIREKLVDQREPSTYFKIIEKANIRCRILDSLGTIKGEFTPLEGEILSGTRQLPAMDHFLIHQTEYHHLIRSWTLVQRMAHDPSSEKDQTIKNLDDYLSVCRQKFMKLKEKGAVGIKDQSAYFRTLHFENTTRAQAEAQFNRFIEDPRRTLGYPESKPLDDYLWHRLVEMAKSLELPMQIHTGHLADNTGRFRNDIRKANAILLTNSLELHHDVHFDLLHGNWPYTGELLYLVKNFPNVTMNLTWMHIINPSAVRMLLYEAVCTIPHSKIIAFGGDHEDSAMHIAAHLGMALDNIAAALSRLIEESWISKSEAVQIAADWLFNNPNKVYQLGFDEVRI